MQIENQTTTIANTNSAAVVQNDTRAKLAVGHNVNVIVDTATAETAKAASSAPTSTTSCIEQLVNDRVQWEQGVRRTSNEQLYALLAKCYAMYIAMGGDGDEAKALRADFKAFVEKNSLRFQAGSHTLTKIVRCVFGSVDRRRVSTYSLVLREALFQKKPADAVAAFIAEKGGVEEIRRSKSPTAKTPKQKAELGKQAVSNNQLAVVSSDVIAQSLDVENVGGDLIAIVTQQADGSLIVRQLIKSQSVLNAALACAYSASKAETQQVAANKEAANDDKIRDEHISRAAGI